MLVTMTMQGDREMVARLGSMPAAVRDALSRKVPALTLALQSKVKVEHLSGPTGAHTLSVGPNYDGHTGGQLRASVFAATQESATVIMGRVGYSADVPYAAIHEFGGTINVPEIVPVKRLALHWISGGKDVFAKRVRAHTVQMPERAPLRTSFTEMRSTIVSGLKDAVHEGITASKGGG